MPQLFHLRISNFKKITLIDVDLESQGNIVTVVGKNDSGKTSFLDAISYLFGGAPFKPEQPIRVGSEVCQIVGRLSNGLIFKRRMTETSEKFTIESEDGANYKSPQAISDALWSPIAFEPDAFSRLEAKKQAAMLRQITGVDTTLLDSRRKTLYAERTKVNAVAESLAAQVEAIVIPVPPAEIGEEIDVAAVAQERAKLVAFNVEYQKVRDEAVAAQQVVAKIAADIARLEASLSTMKEKLAAQTKIKEDIEWVANDHKEDHDTAELDAKIERARDANAIVRGNMQRMNEHKRVIDQKAIAEKSAKAKADEADELTEQIKKIDDDKAVLLSKAKFPVDGMSVDGDEVFVNGIPFSQVASSEQTRIGMAMAMAQKTMQSDKAIKICLIRDGDRIGDEKRAVIQQWAVENGVTIFEERVERPGIVGLEIEDGHLKGAVMGDDESKAAVLSATDGPLIALDDPQEPPKKRRSKKPVDQEPAVATNLFGAPEDPPE